MEIRCGSCGRLLAKGTGTIEIKCPRCRTINHVRAASPDIEGHGASPRERFHGQSLSSTETEPLCTPGR